MSGCAFETTARSMSLCPLGKNMISLTAQRSGPTLCEIDWKLEKRRTVNILVHDQYFTHSRIGRGGVFFQDDTSDKVLVQRV